MPFCNKCGNKLTEEDVFCPECGTPVVDTKSSKMDIEETNDNYKTQVRGKAQSYGVLNLENLAEGHIIDVRYEIKQKIGQGGFGVVYRVYDKKMNIDKALKIIPEAIVNDEEAMADMQAEAQTMISLNHNSIVRVYDFHDTGSVKYIDMEFVEGKTLTKFKLEHPNKQILETKVKELAVKVADGLAYAHSKGIIHKDIKPQNVMLTNGGDVKIMDFGIAETVRTSMSRIQNSTSSGTLVYMSPEQIKGKDVGKESDIYSFGAMLYELLSGHPPFYKGDINYQVLNEKPKPLDSVSDKMNELILKCLEKEYKNRYNNFSDIIKLFGDLVHDYEHLDQQRNAQIKLNNALTTFVSISISTNPEGAIVVIDGKESVGNTPLKIDLEIGNHDIHVSKKGYQSFNDILTIRGSEKFVIELESIMGSISVTTKEEGMIIWINGIKTEFVTPYKFEKIIPKSEYYFQINQMNYLSNTKKCVIRNSENATLLLSSILGSLIVESEKSGMRIWLNGKPTEFVAPHTFMNIIPNKEYIISVDSKIEHSEDYFVRINKNESKLIKIDKFQQVSKEMVFVKGGKFDMGILDRDADEGPVHSVQLDSFYMGRHSVSQQEYEEIMGKNPSSFQAEDVLESGLLGIGRKVEKTTIPKNPVESVSWYDAVEFCNKKSQKEGLTQCYSGTGLNIKCDYKANGYRLPTEAEWEYAARGGKISNKFEYSGSDNVDDVAWHEGNSHKRTHQIETKLSNELAIYDMSGNVWEWCNDWYNKNYYKISQIENPKGPDGGKHRILRGGAWNYHRIICRITYRNYYNPLSSFKYFGFRLVQGIR
jgi:serine/threonine protein kinase